MSKSAGDNLFYLNYDFLEYMEQLAGNQKLDGEVEHNW